jgi:hypothetical protein
MIIESLQVLHAEMELSGPIRSKWPISENLLKRIAIIATCIEGGPLM